MASAQGAAVGRRLEVVRPADRPPASGLLLAHVSKHVNHGPQWRIVDPVEHRDERIVVETERYRITGMLRLPKDGYRSRLTDYLNAAERTFLPLTQVEIVPLENDSPVEHRPFMALSLRHVVLAMPAEQASGESDPGDGTG
jgi:uncharacterized protein DUF6812